MIMDYAALRTVAERNGQLGAGEGRTALAHQALIRIAANRGLIHRGPTFRGSMYVGTLHRPAIYRVPI